MLRLAHRRRLTDLQRKKFRATLMGMQWSGQHEHRLDTVGIVEDMEHERPLHGPCRVCGKPRLTEPNGTTCQSPGSLSHPVGQIPEPPGPRMSHAEMKQVLIRNEGVVCKGCLRVFDDERYLDLDHNVPRSDGGINHISNRMLLCGPCNRAKSNTLTLSGLRKLNKLNSWMSKA